MTAARKNLDTVRRKISRLRPVLAAALVFLVSWYWAARGAAQQPFWPSVPWPDRVPPLLIAPFFAVAMLLIAYLPRDARCRIVRCGVPRAARLLAVGLAVALLSWSVEGLLDRPRAGEWFALVVGLFLGWIAWLAIERSPRARR
jgi:hypothetical protein